MHGQSGPRPTQLSELIWARASETPSRAAFLEGSGAGSVSWASIGRQADELARRLPAGHGERRVGLIVDGATQFCATYLAALAGGLCIAPLDPRATQEELRTQVTELALTDVLVDAPMAGLAGSLLGIGVQTWCVSEPVRSGRPWKLAPVPTALTGLSGQGTRRARVVRHRQPRSAPTGPAVILRTSGSTGHPKLIPLSQAQLLCGARQVATHHGLSVNDRGYCPLPLFHINAQVVGILSTLISGGSLVVDRRLAKDRFWDTVDGSGTTWLNLVPAIISMAAELANASGRHGRIRFARSASVPLADPVRRRFEAVTGTSVLETYGMTEAAGQITANPLRPEDRRPGSVGLPVGLMLRIVGDDGRRITGPEQVGAVEISGPSVVTHYLDGGGNGGFIPARGPAGWLGTGDLAWRDAEGFVYLVGRTDDVINRGGEKLYPAEIENVLLRDPRVAAAVAVGRPHRSLGAVPVALVVRRPSPGDRGAGASGAGVSGAEGGNGDLVEDLHRACATSLSFYKRPVAITVTESLPTGATGKLQRKVVVRDLVVGATAT